MKMVEMTLPREPHLGYWNGRSRKESAIRDDHHSVNNAEPI
jgi:hypothetical protein